MPPVQSTLEDPFSFWLRDAWNDRSSRRLLFVAGTVGAAFCCLRWASQGMRAVETVPSTMRALRLMNSDLDIDKVSLEVKKVDTPMPKPGQVLIKMAAAPINPTDVSEWRHKSKKEGPHHLGIEGSGVVVASGGGIPGRLLLGRNVGVIGTRTYAEYVLTSAIGGALPLPSDLKLEDGCSFFINPFTVIGMVDTVQRMGAKSFINTCGSPQLAVMLARYCVQKGITLISLVRGPQQVECLEAAGSGACHVVDISKHAWREEVASLVRAEHVRIAFDCLAGKMTGILLGLLPPSSTVFVYGVADEPVGDFAPMELIYKKKKLEGWILTTWLWDNGILRGLWRLYTTHLEVCGLLMSCFRSDFLDVRMESALSVYKRSDKRGKQKLRILLTTNTSPQPSGGV